MAPAVSKLLRDSAVSLWAALEPGQVDGVYGSAWLDSRSGMSPIFDPAERLEPRGLELLSVHLEQLFNDEVPPVFKSPASLVLGIVPPGVKAEGHHLPPFARRGSIAPRARLSRRRAL